jgi:hypothetical protein
MEPKMTVTKYATGDVYKVLGQISEAQRLARPELGELPMTDITHRNKPVMTIVPAWVGEYVKAHAAELLERYEAEQRRTAES